MQLHPETGRLGDFRLLSAIWGIERSTDAEDSLRRIRPLKLSQTPHTTALEYEIERGRFVWSD